MRRLFVAVLMGGSALAQRSPVVLERVEPALTAEARVARLQGAVLVSAMVGEDGHARNIRVVRSLGLGLDESAVDAVSRWRFVPNEGGAANIAVSFPPPADKTSWHVSRISFGVPAGASRPVLVSAPYPPSGRKAQNRLASVSFDVSEQGLPVNVQVANALDQEVIDEVIALIREWRFEAAMRNGIPIESRGYLDLVEGQNPEMRLNGERVVPKKKQ